jgi:hypothetical protein
LFFSVSVWTNPKLGVRQPVLLAVAQFVLLPIHLVVWAAATALATPMLPLLGLPLFIIAYPRPTRLWPMALESAPATVAADSTTGSSVSRSSSSSSSSSMPSSSSSLSSMPSSDADFYQQLAPRLHAQIGEWAAAGALSSACSLLGPSSSASSSMSGGALVAGQTLMLRFEKFLVWVGVHEVGCDYCVVRCLLKPITLF